MKKSNITISILSLVVSLFVITACSKDEPTEEEPIVEETGANLIDWKRTFAVDTLWFRPSFVGETTTNGFIILGTQPHEPRIFRFNNQGDTLGQRTYWSYFDKETNFRRGDNNSFFFLADNQLVNINDRGDINWQQTIRLNDFNTCSDGGIVGIDNGFTENGNIARNARIKRTASNGTLMWNTELIGTLKIDDVTEISGQEYVAVAAYQELNGQNLGTLIKLNNQGGIVWQKAQSGQLISGNGSGDVLLMQFGANATEDAHHLHLIQLDRNGEEQWRKTFSDATLFYEGQHLIPNGSNGWLAAFYTTTSYEYNAETNIQVVNIAKDGTVLSDKSYGKTNFVETDRKMLGLTTTSEGGYAVSRVKEILAGNDSLRIELIKVKP